MNRIVKPHPSSMAPLPAPEFDTTPFKQTVHRLGPEDIARLGPWLIPLIQERWGGPTVQVVNGWLRLWQQGNEYNIACTENAVVLAQTEHDPLNPTPHIKEVFNFFKPNCEAEVIAIYEHLIRWGKLRGASRFEFERWSEDAKTMLKKAFPAFKWRSICYLDLE